MVVGHNVQLENKNFSHHLFKTLFAVLDYLCMENQFGGELIIVVSETFLSDQLTRIEGSLNAMKNGNPNVTMRRKERNRTFKKV